MSAFRGWVGAYLLLKDKGVQVLTKLGFTQTQIKLFLTLAKMGEASGRVLADYTGVPRPIVYRTLFELQKKGLIEKEITQPFTFRAVPIEHGLQMLINQRVNECDEIRKQANAFLRKTKKARDKSLGESDYRLVMIDRKERIIERIKHLHDNAKLSVDVLTTLQRLLQFLHETYHSQEEALARGVQYRVVLDSCFSETGLQKNLRSLLSKPNFNLRLSNIALCVNAIIFDAKEACFCYYPSKPVQKSPIIWTNHPSFLAMYQSHFEDIWAVSKRIQLE